MAEYSQLLAGYALSEHLEWDRVRWMGMVVAKSAGAKKIKRPSDLLKLPLIDGDKTKATTAEMIDFLKSQRKDHGR